MLILLMSAFRLADTHSREMNQSSLIRYLAEITWIPSAMLDRRIQWETLDDRRVKATMTDGETKGSLVFHFQADGRISKVVSNDRYWADGDRQVLMPWTGYYRNYQERDGIRIPLEIEAVWNFPEADCSYARFEVEEVDFERSASYTSIYDKNHSLR